MILEGWTANIRFDNGWTTDWADHTWVYAPSNRQYFDCWGSHDGPGKRRVVSGNGSYNRAHCYRCHIPPTFRDTAGIGIYAIDGVCHQTANLFLYTAGRVLDFSVRGYWFSVFSYGVYGRSFLRWIVAPYGTCSIWTPWDASAAGPGEGEDDDQEVAPGDEDPIINIVREVYAPTFSRGKQKHPHELLIEETEKVTQHTLPDINYEKLRRVQLDYLQKRDDAIARGHKEEQLAKRLDDLARKVQKDILKIVGTEHYEQLMGVKPDQFLGIVEPDLAGAAGVPVPPPEVLLKNNEEPKEGDDSSE